MFSKMKSLKLDDYIKIQKAEYTIFKLIPNKSIKNNDTDKMINLINEMVINLNKRFKKEDKKLIIQTNLKASYYIHISRVDISFYLIVPKFFVDRYKAKCIEIWRNVVLEKVDKLPTDFNCTKYKLEYKNNDCLSLDTDKRSNTLLKSNISVLDIIEEQEYVGIFYNFIPTTERNLNYFRFKNLELIKKYKNGDPLKRCYTFLDILKITLKIIIELADDFLSSTKLLKEKKELFLTTPNIITPSTEKKCITPICKTQIAVIAKSNNKDREKTLCKGLASTFNSISGDNSIICKKYDKIINPTNFKMEGARENITSSLECQNFISLPSREIIEKNKVEHIKILERKIPKCLENGVIKIGKVKVKDTTKTAYFSTDEQLQRMSRYLLGAGGSGKSYKMISMAKDIINANDRGLIIIDYIQDCNLSNAIKEFTPKDRLIEIDCSNPNQLQSFSFNELTFSENTDNIEKLNIAMQKASQVQLFLDSINVDSELTPRMVRYLYAGSIVTFYNNINASLKEVCDILQNPYKRANLISSLNELDKKLLSDEIDALNSLTKEDKKKETLENADSKIDGIIDRISWLSSTNVYTKLAYNKSSKDNIDFIDSIKNNKIILIKIPEDKFPNRNIRNIIATFFLNKIWLAKQQLGSSNTLTEIFIDEIHQCYNCQILLEKILVEHRKYKLIPTIALHYLDQCTPSLKNSILNSGGSFIVLSGADPKAFKDLKAHFEKEGYQEEDIAELERYNALCLIKNENTNYSAFVANLKEG